MCEWGLPLASKGEADPTIFIQGSAGFVVRQTSGWSQGHLRLFRAVQGKVQVVLPIKSDDKLIMLKVWRYYLADISRQLMIYSRRHLPDDRDLDSLSAGLAARTLSGFPACLLSILTIWVFVWRFLKRNTLVAKLTNQIKTEVPGQIAMSSSWWNITESRR